MKPLRRDFIGDDDAHLQLLQQSTRSSLIWDIYYQARQAYIYSAEVLGEYEVASDLGYTSINDSSSIGRSYDIIAAEYRHRFGSNQLEFPFESIDAAGNEFDEWRERISSVPQDAWPHLFSWLRYYRYTLDELTKRSRFVRSVMWATVFCVQRSESKKAEDLAREKAQASLEEDILNYFDLRESPDHKHLFEVTVPQTAPVDSL